MPHALSFAPAILRPLLLCAALASCLSSSDEQTLPRAHGAPNVIIILADDLGFADISSYGIHRIETPSIDRIGFEGVRFTDGYATAPVCSPSRAALQTGRYQQRFGFEFNNGPPQRDEAQHLGLNVNEVTIAQALSERGYHTGLVGKWHLGSNDEFYPTNRGYDEFVGILAGATNYIDVSQPGVRVWDPGVGAGGGMLTRRYPPTEVFEGPERIVVRNDNEYLTDYFGRRAAEYVTRNAASEQPYFLYLAFTAPHSPFQVTQEYYDRFPQIEDEGARVYAAMIAALDDAAGEVLDAVERSGEADNTIVVFLSDNGCAGYYPGICSCTPFRGGKLSHYEGGVRVPYMIRWPERYRAGSVFRQPVSTMDIYPTVLAAAGGRLRDDRVYDGVDLTPHVTGRDSSAPHAALMWRRTPMASIRHGDWKLWRSTDGNFTYLFNLREDPNESTNLAESRPDMVQQLQQQYDAWAADLQDPAWPSQPTQTFNVCGTPFELPI